jgi:predicted PurR-regulated permease PerM
LVFLFTIIKLLFFMLLLKRRVKKSMKKMFDMLER